MYPLEYLAYPTGRISPHSFDSSLCFCSDLLIIFSYVHSPSSPKVFIPLLSLQIFCPSFGNLVFRLFTPSMLTIETSWFPHRRQFSNGFPNSNLHVCYTPLVEYDAAANLYLFVVARAVAPVHGPTACRGFSPPTISGRSCPSCGWSNSRACQYAHALFWKFVGQKCEVNLCWIAAMIEWGSLVHASLLV